MNENVIQFNKPTVKSYSAKTEFWQEHSLGVQMCGTLDGFIDFALSNALGKHLGTHTITCEKARELAAKLLIIVDDVQKNCLFDNDPLLVK